MYEPRSPQKARHIPVRPDWLALRSEPVLDAARPIIDAHPTPCCGTHEFKRIAADNSDDEKHALFFQIANRTYRLGIDPAGAIEPAVTSQTRSE